MRPGLASLAFALAFAAVVPARTAAAGTTRRRRALFAAALVTALALVGSPSAAAGHTPPAMSQPYTGQPVGGGCAEVAGHPCPQIPSSGVQFGPFASPPNAVDIRIDDALGERIGAVYTLYDAAGASTKTGGLCGQLRHIAAPAGTYFVTVSLDSPENLGHHCGSLRYGTIGNVLLRLRGTASAQVDDAT